MKVSEFMDEVAGFVVVALIVSIIVLFPSYFENRFRK